MKVLNWKKLSTWEQKNLIERLRRASSSRKLRKETARILKAVRSGSENTLIQLTEQFDGIVLNQICVDTKYTGKNSPLSQFQMEAIDTAYANIFTFHKRQKENLE